MLKNILLYLGVFGTHLAFVGLYAFQQSNFKADQAAAAKVIESEVQASDSQESQLPQLPLR